MVMVQSRHMGCQPPRCSFQEGPFGELPWIFAVYCGNRKAKGMIWRGLKQVSEASVYLAPSSLAWRSLSCLLLASLTGKELVVE